MGVDLTLIAADKERGLVAFSVVRCTSLWEYFRTLDAVPEPQNLEELSMVEFYYGWPTTGTGSKRNHKPSKLQQRPFRFARGPTLPKTDAYGESIVWTQLKNVKEIFELEIGSGKPFECVSYEDFRSLLSDDAVVAIYWH